MSEATATIGHNSLMAFYSEQNAALPDYLAREHEPLLSRVRDLEEEYLKRPNIVDSDDIERKQTDFGGKIAKCLKDAAAQKKVAKEPVTAGVKIVDDFFTRLTAPLETAMRQVERSINTYKDERRAAEQRRQAEQARIAREAAEEAARARKIADEQAEVARRAAVEAETIDRQSEIAAEQQAAEREAQRLATAAADAAKAAKPVEQAKVVGDTGTASIQRATWTGDIENLETLDLNALRYHLTRAAMEAAVRAFAVHTKGTQHLTGAVIYQKTSTSFRG